MAKFLNIEYVYFFSTTVPKANITNGVYLSHFKFSGFSTIPTTLFYRKARAISLTVTASSNYNRRNDKIYMRLDSCLVIPPPPKFKIPRAIVKFLGGAFVEAVPELTYSYLKELLAKEGYLIISVPYNVTFDHEEAAKQVYERFNSCLDTIVSSGVLTANLKPEDLANLPLF